ncbi:MAG: dihydrodipicolinate synthase family protein [Azospirillaceae bacterium]
MTTATGDGGIHPVLYALFDRQGELDRGAMRAQAEICLSMGAAGIVVLGLATEVRSLAPAERHRLVEWIGADIAGRVPFVVTIFENAPEAQLEAARHAADHGADWVVYQPPGQSDLPLEQAFDRVLARSPLPAAIQNAPGFIGRGLDIDQILALASRHAAFRRIKQEVSAVDTAELIDRLEGRLAVFSGRGGIELIDCWKAGTVGHVPAPEYADRLIGIWRLLVAGDEAGAMDEYERVLPLATFVLQSIDSLLTYGKLLLCARHGLPYHLRQPQLRITRFGLDRLTAHAARAGIAVDLERAITDPVR